MTPLNPVLRRELMERWRGRRATVTITVYLAVLGGILYLLYRVGVALLRSQFGFGFGGGGFIGGNAGPALGRYLFDGLLFSVLLLVLFVSPGYAAAQLSGERERRTLPLLQVTLLRPWQIVVGKLGASVAWLTLLVTAALPLGGAALFLGGVAITDLLRAVAFILAIAIGVAGMAIGISSLVKRTTAAVVLTYGAVLGLTLGTLFLAGVEAVLGTQRGGELRTPLALYANPFLGLADAARADDDALASGFGLPSPLTLFSAALPGSGVFGARADLVGEPGVSLEAIQVGPDLQPLGPPVGGQPPAGRRPVWLQIGGLYLGLGALGLAVATRRVRPGRVSRGERGAAAGGPRAPDATAWPAPAVPGGTGS